MRRHVGGIGVRTLRPVCQSGLACNTYSTVWTGRTASKYCIYSILAVLSLQAYAICFPHVVHLKSLQRRRGENLGLDLSGPCPEKTPSHSYDDLSMVRLLRYDDMVDAVRLDFLFGSNMHLVQLIAIQYNGKNARLSIALPLTTHHAPIAHCTIALDAPSALACTSKALTAGL